MRTAVFFSIFIGVFALMNFYIYRRFVKKLGVSLKIRRLLKFGLLFLFVSEIAYALSFRLDILPSFVYYVLSTAIAVSFMLFITALLYDLLHITLHKTTIEGRQRDALKVLLDVLMILLFSIYLLAGFIGGQNDPILKRVAVEIPRFPFEKFVITHVTDVHVGNTIKRDFVTEMVDTINAQQSDLVIITGDLVDKDVEKAAYDLEPLKGIRARYGTFFVYGNHEYFHGYQKIGEHLKTLGITVLDDRSVVIGEGAKEFDLVGLKDKVGERMGFGIPDLPKAFASVDQDTPTIVLAHQPVMIEALEAYGPDLVLSGHTHGGQIFPFSYLVKLAQPYLAGLFQHSADTQIYVSRGTGFWGPPIRVLAPSEISRLEIRGKKGE
jgi:predicted MPP superfamily phosphohydrolase